ncbi:hypothetical protein J4E89_006655 [Alternaria sp. Ai002NY15]|nr:hypothetical protein J4E89_006655 [Alternaria sp. Ai002NY15]
MAVDRSFGVALPSSKPSPSMPSMPSTPSTPATPAMPSMPSTPSSITTLDEYFIWLVWTLLSDTPNSIKNPKLDSIMPSIEALENLLNASHLTVSDDLVEVLQAPTPPSIEWLKSLPSMATNAWGIYLLVLEKPFCRPLVYVGSGTNSKRGLNVRLYNYESGTSLPVRVEDALNEGYVIASKGVLCSCPLPLLSSRFPLRGLCLLVEAVFAVVFSALEDRTKTYNLPLLCPWHVDTFEYDGLCTHSSISEGIRGEAEHLDVVQKLFPQVNDNKTDAEKNETLAKENAERETRIAEQNAKLLEQKAKRAAESIKGCTERKRIRYYNFKAVDFEGWQAWRRGYNQTQALKPELAGQKKVQLQNFYANNRASGKFRCEPCDINFPGKYQFDFHNKSQDHADVASGFKPARKLRVLTPAQERTRLIDGASRTARRAAAKASGLYRCRPCDKNYGCNGNLVSHCRSKAHGRMVAAAATAAAAATSQSPA